MSLYKDSTLAMIPTAYKDGKLYSVRPTDGSGDFTFSRGTTATRVDVNGLIEKGRENVLTYSNTFSSWTFSSASVTSGHSGYDGTNTAWELLSTAASCRVSQTISTSGVQTMSVYAKQGSVNWMALYVVATAPPYVYFDLANGVLGGVQNNVIDASIEDIGGGWYRCTIAFDKTATELRIFTATANGILTTTSGDSIYIQDAQLESGLVSTDVITTTTTSVSAGILEDMPRLDYSGGASCPSLLLEPSRTNSMLHSEYISTYFFYTNASATNNATTSPEGVVNAASVIPNATSGMHQIASSNISASGSFTLSAFVKAGELNKVAIRESNATGAYASFDLSSGTKIEDNVSGASFIEPFENDWYRIGVTYTHSGNIRLGINLLDNSYTTGNPSSGATYWSSNGTDKLYVYGLQCELGATYETSYIPTYGSSVTRSADALETSPYDYQSQGVLGANVGTIILDCETIGTSTGSNDFHMFGEVKSIADGYLFRANTGTTIDILERDSNSTSAQWTGIAVKQTRNKIGVSYNGADVDVYVNGVAKSVSSGTPVGGGNINGFANSTSNSAGLIIHQILLFPNKLTDSEMASITTL